MFNDIKLLTFLLKTKYLSEFDIVNVDCPESCKQYYVHKLYKVCRPNVQGEITLLLSKIKLNVACNNF